MPFGAEEYRHWKPNPIITGWLCNKVIKPTDVVLELGPGHCPFPRANVAVDRLDWSTLQLQWDKHKVEKRPQEFHHADFTSRLNFKDKVFDFIYCRHTLEDMYDPFFLLEEMQRIGKAGYIETPSPIAELTRGIDGYKNSSLWRGYYHHRYIVWVHNGTLHFITKYPLVEHCGFDESVLEYTLRRGPELWNTYCLWAGGIKYRHWEDPFDFDVKGYQELLWSTVQQSAESTVNFCNMVNEEMQRNAA